MTVATTELSSARRGSFSALSSIVNCGSTISRQAQITTAATKAVTSPRP